MARAEVLLLSRPAPPLHHHHHSPFLRLPSSLTSVASVSARSAFPRPIRPCFPPTPPRSPRFRVSAATNLNSTSTSTNDGGGGGAAPPAPASYLDMWKRATERYEKERHGNEGNDGPSLPPSSDSTPQQQQEDPGVWDRRHQQFLQMLQVPAEERDKAQVQQMIERAQNALASAKALIKEEPLPPNPLSSSSPPLSAGSVDYGSVSSESTRKSSNTSPGTPENAAGQERQHPSFATSFPPFEKTSSGDGGTPGTDYWSWSPPASDLDENSVLSEKVEPFAARVKPTVPFPLVLEKEKVDLPILYNSDIDIFKNSAKPFLPPLQSSLVEVQEETQSSEVFSNGSALSMPSLVEPETQDEVKVSDRIISTKETGEEVRENGVICKWTVIRGVSTDGKVQWEEKFWEAFDDGEYKELGAAKSGRDLYGNVWNEFWKESLWKDADSGLLHIEKTADKWGTNDYGGEWHENWREHYDASGHVVKSADKWAKIDTATPLEPGHAHVWHERWGETYNGEGSSVKYTDKWAERAEPGGGWSKWGDKWDEHFNDYGHGVKQGETWWEGVSGERWNRTWGEGHNGTGWVHKYGKSSCGEHWDTYEQQETWYERYAHFGFRNCLENSPHLQQVGTEEETEKEKEKEQEPTYE